MPYKVVQVPNHLPLAIVLGQKPFKPTQFYGKQKEPELVPGVDGSLKPDVNCNYCKDLGHMKFNCPKLKEKEARMAGRQSQQFKKGN